MKKTVILEEEVKNSEGLVFAKMRTVLRGDGSTPNVMSMGMSAPIGFNDDGTAILPKHEDEVLKIRQTQMMAEAIKEQKQLCVENGVDPELVNIINAERGERRKSVSTKGQARELRLDC